jgi:hypothetical protein
MIDEHAVWDYWLEYVCDGSHPNTTHLIVQPGDTVCTTSWAQAWPMPYEQWLAAVCALIKDSHPEVSTATLYRKRRRQPSTDPI